MFLLRKPTAEFIEATMRDGRSPLLLLAKPVLRRVQRRFCTQSSAAMARLPPPDAAFRRFGMNVSVRS